MPQFKDIKPKFILYEFKHSKIIKIFQSEARIDVEFENTSLIFQMYEKRTGYIGFNVDYYLGVPISHTDTQKIIEEIKLDVISLVVKRLTKHISIIQTSHRYNMSYNHLHRWLEWDDLDNYHKCFKLKTLNLYSDFKYILKNWSDFEQLFRTHLWARQCLISFLASRGKLYELSGSKQWIIEETPHFWLYEILVHEDVTPWHNKPWDRDKKRVINKYRSSYGDKQNTHDVYYALTGNEPRPLMITASIVHLSLPFMKQFNIVFGKKSKWCIKRVTEIYDKCKQDPHNIDYEFLKATITLNYRSLLWNFKHMEQKTKKQYKLLPIAETLYEIIRMAQNAEMTDDERKDVSELSAYIEQFKLTMV